MAVGDTYVFPGFLTPVLTLFFPKPPTTFLTCLCRGERRKYARKKSRLKWGSNSQLPGHESDMLTTELPGQGQDFGAAEHILQAKSFDSGQPAWSAQADLVRYFLQMHYAPFSYNMVYVHKFPAANRI